MEKLLTFMNYWLGKLYIPCGIPADKQMHGLSGFVGGAAMMWLTDITLISILVVAIIACLKEIYDYEHKSIHTPDFWDWVATTIGGVLGTVIVSLI
jgi:hypothetical protein